MRSHKTVARGPWKILSGNIAELDFTVSVSISSKIINELNTKIKGKSTQRKSKFQIIFEINNLH
jgi:hypothetical protein